MESEDIIQDFCILRNKFFVSLEEQDIPVRRLLLFLKDDCVQQQVSGITTLEDVITFIKRNSTFYDYQLVKYMIRSTGTDMDEQQLKEYERTFAHYAQRRIYECPSTFGTTSESDEDTKLHLKLDSMYDKCKLDELKKIQYRLCSILRISVCVYRLMSVERGCFMLTLVTPHHVQGATFPLSTEQEGQLAEMGVLQLNSEGYKFMNRQESK